MSRCVFSFFLQTKKVKMNGMKMVSYNLNKYLLSTVYLRGKNRNKWQAAYTSTLESCVKSLYGLYREIK